MKPSSLLLLACLSAAVLAACNKRDDADIPAATPSADAAAAATATEPVPAPAGSATAAGDQYHAARDACLAEVARQAGVAKEQLGVTEVLWAEAGVGVTIQVPGAQAPWSCLSDENGNVQGAAYTGSEGRL